MARIHLQRFYFCTEIRADDPGTFVGNRGYHFEEGSVLSILTPRLAGGLVGEWQRDAVNAQLSMHIALAATAASL